MVKLRWWEPWDPNQTIAWEPEGSFPPPPQLYSTLEPHQQRVRKLVISNLTLIVIGGRWSAVRGVGWEEDKENIWVCLMLWWSLWTQWSRLMTMKKPDYVLTTKYIFTVQPPTHQWLIWTWTVWIWSIACLLSDHHQNPSFRPFPTKLSVLCLPGIKGVSYFVFHPYWHTPPVIYTAQPFIFKILKVTAVWFYPTSTLQLDNPASVSSLGGEMWKVRC